MTRPNTSGNCPEGYSPCYNQSAPENMVCYNNLRSKDEQCPITNLTFWHLNQTVEWVDQVNFTSIVFNSTTNLLFTTNSDSRPLTTFKVAYDPCINPLDLSTPGGLSYTNYYPGEL